MVIMIKFVKVHYRHFVKMICLLRALVQLAVNSLSFWVNLKAIHQMSMTDQ